MSTLTTHFKSYSQAINFIVSQMEECEKLFREAKKANSVRLAEKAAQEHKRWMLLLAENLKSLNKPVINKVFESAFSTIPIENKSVSDENFVRDDHAVVLNDKHS